MVSTGALTAVYFVKSSCPIGTCENSPRNTAKKRRNEKSPDRSTAPRSRSRSRSRGTSPSDLNQSFTDTSYVALGNFIDGSNHEGSSLASQSSLSFEKQIAVQMASQADTSFTGTAYYELEEAGDDNGGGITIDDGVLDGLEEVLRETTEDFKRLSEGNGDDVEDNEQYRLV